MFFEQYIKTEKYRSFGGPHLSFISLALQHQIAIFLQSQFKTAVV